MAEGTQSIDRAATILNIVAREHKNGASFADIMNETQLKRPTTRRLLMALVEHGFVEFDGDSKRYHLGPKIYEFGLQVLPFFDFQEVYRPSLMRLVESTGDTVFLNRLVGDDMVCIARETGSFPVKAFVLDVGVQRPLGLGAGGLAILAAMDEAQAQAMLQRNQKRLKDSDTAPERIPVLIEEARQKGYVSREVSRLGIRTVAMAILDSAGTPFASLSVSTIQERMRGDHLEMVVNALEREVRRINDKLSKMRPLHPLHSR